MAPMITNAADTRFLFGTFKMVAAAPMFFGAVVSGIGITYDPDTGHPDGGLIQQIDLQVRDEHSMIKVYASSADIAANVADLNVAFADTDAPWFDPAQFFGTALMDNAAALTGATDIESVNDDAHDLTVEDILAADLALQTVDTNLKTAQTALSLETGDILTAKELLAIYSAAGTPPAQDIAAEIAPEIAPEIDEIDLMSLLHANTNITSADDLFQTDAATQEEDLFVGFI